MINYELINGLHEIGESINVPRPIKEALSWELAAELNRRHPDRFVIVELHPQFMYDVLALWDVQANHPALLMNRSGMSHIVSPSNLNWTQVLNTPNRRHIVELIERELDFGSPSETPPTTQSSIGPMLIAQFLRRTCLDKNKWIAANGLESTNMGDFVREPLFSNFGISAERRRSTKVHEEISDGYEYWFLMPCKQFGDENHVDEVSPWEADSQPLAMLNTISGELHIRGKVVNLLKEYSLCSRSIVKLTDTLLF